MKKMYNAPSACPIPRSRYGITEVNNGPTIAYAATVITAVGHGHDREPHRSSA